MMTILITASTFPRWKGDSVPNFVLDQALALKKLNPDTPIHILAPHHKGAKRSECWDSIHIHRFRYMLPEGWQKLVYPAIHPNIRHNKWLALLIPMLFLTEFFALVSLIRKIRPRVVYSHWFTPQGIVGGLACAMFKIPHVFTSHSSDTQILRKIPFFGPAILRFFVRRVSACTVVSRRSYEKLRSFFSDEEWASIDEKVQIIPMGVDLESFHSESAKNEVESTNRSILFMGRLSEKKGITYLLQAFKSIISSSTEGETGNKSIQSVELRIAGDGELASQVKVEISSLGLDDQVRMLGYIDGDEKLQQVAAADILVVPSIITDDGDAEGLPVSLMEGLAAGKLCVATDVSGADEVLVDGENGYLIGQKNVEALSDALKKALTLSEQESAQMQEKARETAETFDWAVIAKRHQAHLFDQLPE